MSDTEEESSGSDGNWPVNETWLRGILQSNHPNDKDISILVSASACASSVCEAPKPKPTAKYQYSRTVLQPILAGL